MQRNLQVKLTCVFALLFPVPFFVSCQNSDGLVEKRYEMKVYYMIGFNPIWDPGAEKREALQKEEARERWKELSEEDVNMIVWLEAQGIPFFEVEGSSLKYYDKPKASEVNIDSLYYGYIEVKNTPENLEKLEKWISYNDRRHIELNAKEPVPSNPDLDKYLR